MHDIDFPYLHSSFRSYVEDNVGSYPRTVGDGFLAVFDMVSVDIIPFPL